MTRNVTNDANYQKLMRRSKLSDFGLRRKKLRNSDSLTSDFQSWSKNYEQTLNIDIFHISFDTSINFRNVIFYEGFEHIFQELLSISVRWLADKGIWWQLITIIKLMRRHFLASSPIQNMYYLLHNSEISPYYMYT